MSRAEDRRRAGRGLDDGTRPPNPSFSGQYDDSWAALIGIDDYAHYNKLRFAAADAVAVARALIDHRRFPPKHVFLIAKPAGGALREDLAPWLATNQDQLGRVDDQATKAAIEQLLYETIARKAKTNDRVLIYFAGHGVPRSASIDLRDAIPYLAPAEAQQGNWRGHIDLQDLLKECSFLAAKHVLCVFDACCTGLADKRASEEAKSYEQKMLRFKARQCLTAGTREQRVDDSSPGVAHSPFTAKLLGLLDGTIETKNDEALCVSLVAAKLKSDVGGQRTGSEQVPALFPAPGHNQRGEFMFAALTAPLTLEEQSALAWSLVHSVGRPLDEPAPIEFAVKLWREILRAKDGDRWRHDALRERGRAHLMLRNADEARADLSDAGLNADPDAKLLRAIACLEQDQLEEAADALEALLRICPTHPYADWARLAIPVARKPRGRRIALLIGVEEIPAIKGMRLPSRKNVEEMATLLKEALGFTTVKSLLDADATIDKIRAAFKELAADMKKDDSFVCYISGPGYMHRSGPSPAVEVAVYPAHDLDPAHQRLLTENDIDGAFRSLPAHDRLLITDGHHLAPSGTKLTGYRFLHACGREELTSNRTDRGGTRRGAFTHALIAALRTLGNVPISRLMTRVQSELAKLPRPQTPGYNGSGATRFLEPRPVPLEIIEFAELSHRAFSAERIGDFSRWLMEVERLARDKGDKISMAPLWLAIGRGLLARSDIVRASDALARANDALARANDTLARANDALARTNDTLARANDALARASDGLARANDTLARASEALIRADDLRALVPLIQAQVLRDQYADALDSWRQWYDRRGPAMPTADSPDARELGTLLEAACAGPRRALLVATDDDGKAGARDLIDRAREALLNRFDVPEAGIQVLCNASKDDIVAAFRALTCATPGPAFFLFIGPGFDDVEICLSTIDGGRATSNLHVSELCAMADAGSQLTAALLITRAEPPSGASQRGCSVSTAAREQPELGIATLVVAPHLHRDVAAAARPLDAGSLIKVLELRGNASFTLGAWRSEFGAQGSRLSGNHAAALLPYTTRRDRVLELARHIAQASLPPVVASLERLATQPEDAAEAWLQLAIVEAQRERWDEARNAINESLARRRAGDSERRNGSERVATAGEFPEAHYQHGRILLALEHYTHAEAELRLAVEEQRDHARAHYYREQAIRALIETDLEERRAASRRSYLMYGAPFGVDDDRSMEVS